MKHPSARILSCAGHLDALGWRIRREGLEALPAILRRIRRRVSEHLHGELGLESPRHPMMATLGQGFVF